MRARIAALTALASAGVIIRADHLEGAGQREYGFLMKLSALRITLALLVMFGFASSGSSQPTSPILEKKFAFPWPVDWKGGGNTEISLSAVAWGPANSPEMLSKGEQPRNHYRVKPKFFPGRPYALALRLRAKRRMPASGLFVPSNLFRVKNVEGDLEAPMDLTPQGFVPGGPAELHFDNNNVAETWDFFPVSPDEKQFLFQVFQRTGFMGAAGRPVLSFKIVPKHEGFLIINATAGAQSACLDFAARKFTGTIGASTKVTIQLARQGTKLSGTEQYARVGKTLWLKGAADFNDRFRLSESYPENRVTGIFDGKFTLRCQAMVGYFSKPDGSQLQPFEFRVPGIR